MNDAERIFAYRALRISRGDTTPLPGFEQDDYIRNGPFAKISFGELIEDYIAVRRASITLFRNLDERPGRVEEQRARTKSRCGRSLTSSRDTSCIIVRSLSRSIFRVRDSRHEAARIFADSSLLNSWLRFLSSNCFAARARMPTPSHA